MGDTWRWVGTLPLTQILILTLLTVPYSPYTNPNRYCNIVIYSVHTLIITLAYWVIGFIIWLSFRNPLEESWERRNHMPCLLFHALACDFISLSSLQSCHYFLKSAFLLSSAFVLQYFSTKSYVNSFSLFSYHLRLSFDVSSRKPSCIRTVSSHSLIFTGLMLFLPPNQHR